MSTWESRGRGDRRWSIRRSEDRFTLTTAHGEQAFSGEDLAAVSVSVRWWRGAVTVAGGPRLRGLSRQQARELDAALARALDRHRIELAVAWRDAVLGPLDAAVATSRWIPVSTRKQLESRRPAFEPAAVLAGVEEREDALSLTERAALTFLSTDLSALVSERNERILDDEASQRREFFDRVESRPLTPEQVRAVVTMDDRVLVVAAAGSGKTSVMVARAAYAVSRGFVRPERVLLLAFNKDAARELQERVRSRFEALGLPVDGIRATTFHAFGLEVIGRATGRKPRAASWLQAGEDLRVIERIVDELRDRSPEFRYRWDLFRLVYARASAEPAAGEPDGYDSARREAGFRTARNEVLKSESERLVADWLYFHGVAYEYERPYAVDVADARHGQYRPDFYYPTVDAWHEHWALGRNGHPPAEFEGYADTMQWKRRLHAEHGTTLLETTWSEVIDGSGLTQLGEQLRHLGLELDWNPDRPVHGTPPLTHGDLARLVRSVMTHVKGNALSSEDLDRRAAEGGRVTMRTRLFLEIYWEIHDAWQARLNAEECVDFEDMLVQAAAHLEQGTARQEYDLVLVDELQDASAARLRLTAALVQLPGTCLLAVGDDWQSINRFAGADLSVMTRFHELLGDGPTLRLQTTFRCSQELADVAGAFVAKNPRQLRKAVVSAQGKRGTPPVRVVRVADAAGVPTAVAEALEALAARVRRGDVEPGRSGRVSVDILGRYRFQHDVLPHRPPSELAVTFRTVHSSKGLEADYVIVPHLIRGRHGFPSGVVDDPLLDLVMTDPDPYPHAEERRLFYVALTRARREALVITVAGQESPFLVELVANGSVEIPGGSGQVQACPRCGKGMLTTRNGPRGAFLGCSRFPACTHTCPQLPVAGAVRPGVSGN